MTNYHSRGTTVRVVIYSRITGKELGALINPCIAYVEEWSKLFDMVVECVCGGAYAKEVM